MLDLNASIICNYYALVEGQRTESKGILTFVVSRFIFFLKFILIFFFFFSFFLYFSGRSTHHSVRHISVRLLVYV